MSYTNGFMASHTQKPITQPTIVAITHWRTRLRSDREVVLIVVTRFHVQIGRASHYCPSKLR